MKQAKPSEEKKSSTASKSVESKSTTSKSSASKSVALKSRTSKDKSPKEKLSKEKSLKPELSKSAKGSGKPEKSAASANKIKKNIKADEALSESDSAEKTTKHFSDDEKIQKVLARAGLGSRREMEKAIEAGEIKVNDRVAQLGDRITAKDKIFFRGQRVTLAKEAARRRVILYNKPEGEICSRTDPEGRRTVYENLPSLKGERWISIGRLDFNTSGLLLFTNDGELANKLMHPSSVIDREYLVRIQGDVDDDMKRNLLQGVELEDGPARFTDIVDGAGESRNRWYYCVVMEGRNREVRRLWESQGVKVSRLKRVRYGSIFIPSHVRVGQWIDLNENEIADLCKTAGFSNNKHTRIMKPSREELSQRQRHENKLRTNPKSPRTPKPAPRRGE